MSKKKQGLDDNVKAIGKESSAAQQELSYLDSSHNMAKTQASQKDTRLRNFAFIVYPESAPSDWITILEDMHIPTLISPLHDKDVNPDGKQKKPHYHVLIMFDNKKTLEQFAEVRDAVGGVGREDVQSPRGYARYLCHLDNPEKYQYNRSDIIALNGARFESVAMNTADFQQDLTRILDIAKEHDTTNLSDLEEILRADALELYSAFVHYNAYVLRILKARQYKEQDNRDRQYKEALRQRAAREEQERLRRLNEEQDSK